LFWLRLSRALLGRSRPHYSALGLLVALFSLITLVVISSQPSKTLDLIDDFTNAKTDKVARLSGKNSAGRQSG